MATKKVAQPKRAISTLAEAKRFGEEYLRVRAAAADMSKKEAEMKATLVQAVQDLGYTDDKGHQWLELELSTATAFKREKRVSKTFNEERAARWLSAKGRYDEFTETIVQLDEDKILGAAYTDGKGSLPDKTVQSWYDLSETMAFKVEK